MVVVRIALLAFIAAAVVSAAPVRKRTRPAPPTADSEPTLRMRLRSSTTTAVTPSTAHCPPSSPAPSSPDIVTPSFDLGLSLGPKRVPKLTVTLPSNSEPSTGCAQPESGPDLTLSLGSSSSGSNMKQPVIDRDEDLIVNFVSKLSGCIDDNGSGVIDLSPTAVDGPEKELNLSLSLSVPPIRQDSLRGSTSGCAATEPSRPAPLTYEQKLALLPDLVLDSGDPVQSYLDFCRFFRNEPSSEELLILQPPDADDDLLSNPANDAFWLNLTLQKLIMAANGYKKKDQDDYLPVLICFRFCCKSSLTEFHRRWGRSSFPLLGFAMCCPGPRRGTPCGWPRRTPPSAPNFEPVADDNGIHDFPGLPRINRSDTATKLAFARRLEHFVRTKAPTEHLSIVMWFYYTRTAIPILKRLRESFDGNDAKFLLEFGPKCENDVFELRREGVDEMVTTD